MKQGTRAMAGAVALVRAARHGGARGGQGPRDRGRRRVEGRTRTAAWRSSCTCRTGRTRTPPPSARWRAQGAKKAPKPPPPQENSYSFTGLFWDVAAGRAELQPGRLAAAAARRPRSTNTLRTWSSVSGSNFRIRSAARRRRCPSLVRECPGAQRNDRSNDVGWAQLSERHARRDVVDERHRRGRHGDQHALHVDHRLHARSRAPSTSSRSTCTRTATSPASATRPTSAP